MLFKIKGLHMTENAIKSWVEEEVLNYIVKINQFSNDDFEIPCILYTLTSCVAGRASYYNYTINFNLILLKENIPSFSQTIGHEIAHLLAKKMYQNNPIYGSLTSHGRYWKDAMAILRLSPKRCHDYDTSNIISKKVQQRKWLYSCNCSQHVVSTTIHNKIQKHAPSYSCRYCRNKLQFIKQSKMKWEL